MPCQTFTEVILLFFLLAPFLGFGVGICISAAVNVYSWFRCYRSLKQSCKCIRCAGEEIRNGREQQNLLD